MHQANSDLTITEVLTDPMIRAVMRADGVTTNEMKTLLYSAASALRQTQPGTVTPRNIRPIFLPRRNAGCSRWCTLLRRVPTCA